MLEPRPWLTPIVAERIGSVLGDLQDLSPPTVIERVERLAGDNRRIHEQDCFNLNPATNVMNPRAEALLASGIGTRPSLGYPGDKYEMGLEAIEEIEVIAAELAARVFEAKYTEIRVPSGAMANLYAFMAVCQPGDTIIAPPPEIGGHVTHHLAGCAGLYGLNVVAAPVDAGGYTVDVERLADLAERVRPALITVGGSLNLFEHPVSDIGRIAEEVGARLLFDAAHQCGIIAGRSWANPLDQGADLMTMSTYKSLGGPPGGLVVTNDAGIAQRLEAVAFPGLTANFDAAKSAALAVTLADWLEHGPAYAEQMIAVSEAMAEAFDQADIPVFAGRDGFTRSHQFAVEAAAFGGGQAAAKHLRQAGFLSCGIGLPVAPVAGDSNGLRLGTPELVRWGVGLEHVDDLVDLVAAALHSDHPASLAEPTRQFRLRFNTLHYIIA
ncbi:MAG: aminotransferase class I/II-fold pyridoxal phosphate-dependent enzyme [Acidimicrobiia bacterium]|nr:aminotransferase class I/II-fold pyridoxal phosphate-dependent enzyme [Acidimicrobiia bacterium]